MDHTETISSLLITPLRFVTLVVLGKRASTIILKLAQADYYEKTKNEVPIHLIDDILLELDMKNMKKVLNLLNRGDQKIITTTERAKLPEIFSCDRVFHVTKKGCISW